MNYELRGVIYEMRYEAIMLFCIVFLFSSCSYIADIDREGETISKEIAWNGASRIEILAPVRFIPINSDECKIRLTGMDFIVNDYEITDAGDTLIIKHKKSLNIQENKIATLEVYATDFKTIFINSPCQLASYDTLTFNSLQMIVNGSGALMTGHLLLKGNDFRFMAFGGSNRCRPRFSGTVNSAYFQLQGGSDADASSLLTSMAVVEQRSNGNCSVSISNHLKATIYSTGNIYCWGKPETEFVRVENNLMQATGELVYR
ncbi:MAG: DUF2807 domain-containing protein [Cytophagaceae bacterium]|jgi:hypothetical protein|nr:DUF2807 domain-containing protein [Cytophagaceae bacterium]